MKKQSKTIVILAIAGALYCAGAEPETGEIKSFTGILTTGSDANGAPQLQILSSKEKSPPTLNFVSDALTYDSSNGVVSNGVVTFSNGNQVTAILSGSGSTTPITTTFLGIGSSEISGEVAAQLPIDPGTGLIVRNIIPDSPAAQAGLKENDVIIKFDDQILVSPKQLQTLVHNKKPGDEIAIAYLRKGEQRIAKATLASHQEDSGTNKVNLNFSPAVDAVVEKLNTLHSIPGMFKSIRVDKDGKVTSINGLTSGSETLEMTVQKLELEIDSLSNKLKQNDDPAQNAKLAKLRDELAALIAQIQNAQNDVVRALRNKRDAEAKAAATFGASQPETKPEPSSGTDPLR